ncbi:hypothetical protein [Rubellimicrobium arenae]|uniref:hypothetical protein n=1 Tax=Rubellimicrobium arenae TaxID=2817372 RepID=UPI001B3159AD|nr:hypothetical protein [Rubellimicrobium arenae]
MPGKGAALALDAAFLGLAPMAGMAQDWTVKGVLGSVQTPVLTEEDADADADDPARSFSSPA